MAIRTRYAPSPTGDPHLGILRTAIFDYLLARGQGGTFILRLEDTDQKREKEGSERSILESLRWLGVEPDEGLVLNPEGQPIQVGEFGPYIQSQRLSIYKDQLQRLLESGQAYRCFCSPERLEAVRQEQQQNHLPPRYDRHCRGLSPDEGARRVAAGESYVIRHAIPAGRTITFTDVIRGEISFQSDDLDDYILLKSDGFPTYQLANVIDDHLMEISHVLRGEEWIPSTPKNLLLYEAFGWSPPAYAHVPVILGPDRKRKLSKREGAEPALYYRDHGYLPEAVLNFLAFLGWSPGTDEEILSLEQLSARFTLERVQKSPAVFDPARLDYLNGWYIRQLSTGEVTERLLPFWEQAGLLRRVGEGWELTHPLELPGDGQLGPYLMQVAGTIQERLKHFDEAGELSHFFFERPTVSQELLIPRKGEITQTRTVLGEVIKVLEAFPTPWGLTELQEKLQAFITEKGYKNGEVLWPVRAALTGAPASPGAFEMLSVLGPHESLLRLKAAEAILS